MIHQERHPAAGTTVSLRDDIEIKHNLLGNVAGNEFVVEDWNDRVLGRSWMHAEGNPTALLYAIRSGLSEHPLPIDDEVLYGKVDGLGMLVHVSELA